jgi:hypothetical protein
MPLWPFRRRPKFEDLALSDLAEMFKADPEDPTPFGDLLDSSRLDYSVASLALVDKHLDVVRQRDPQGEALVKFILRCGAYAGEVIRRNTPPPKEWHWVGYKTAARLSPQIAELGEGLGAAAILWDTADEFCFPLAKVGKYLENGPEDSLEFFAKVIIAGIQKGQAPAVS